MRRLSQSWLARQQIHQGACNSASGGRQAAAGFLQGVGAAVPRRGSAAGGARGRAQRESWLHRQAWCGGAGQDAGHYVVHLRA